MSDKSKPSHIERTVYVQPDVTPGSSLRYGDWSDSPHAVYWCEKRKHGDLGNISEGYYRNDRVPLTIIEAATGSDYSGNLVEKSNYRTLKAEFPWLVELYGGYGTFGLAYLGKRENQNDRLIEAIDGLADYPLFSEDDHSQLEMETVEEQWVSDGRDEWKRALCKMWALDGREYDADRLDDNLLVDQLWRDCCELLRGGEEYLNEQGDSIYFPIDRVIHDIRADRGGIYRATYAYDDNRPIIEKLEDLRMLALVPDDSTTKPL